MKALIYCILLALRMLTKSQKRKKRSKVTNIATGGIFSWRKTYMRTNNLRLNVCDQYCTRYKVHYHTKLQVSRFSSLGEHVLTSIGLITAAILKQLIKQHLFTLPIMDGYSNPWLPHHPVGQGPFFSGERTQVRKVFAGQFPYRNYDLVYYPCFTSFLHRDQTFRPTWSLDILTSSGRKDNLYGRF